MNPRGISILHKREEYARVSCYHSREILGINIIRGACPGRGAETAIINTDLQLVRSDGPGEGVQDIDLPLDIGGSAHRDGIIISIWKAYGSSVIGRRGREKSRGGWHHGAMKVRKGIDITTSVSAPVRAEVVHLVGSEQNGCTRGHSVRIRILSLYALPGSSRAIRRCVVVACKQGDFLGQVMVNADAGRVDGGGIGDCRGDVRLARICDVIACRVDEGCARIRQRQGVDERLIDWRNRRPGGRRVERARSVYLRQPQPQPFEGKEEKGFAF